MVEIVKRLGWSYVSIIYEESNYGIKVSGGDIFLKDFDGLRYFTAKKKKLRGL